MDNVLLSAENLSAGYHGREILHDLSVRFYSGKITAIVGPNGCGKSTLLKTLIRLVPRKSGNINAGGERIDTLSSSALARQVAYLPQNKRIPDLTVKTMVLHGRFAHLTYPRRYRKEDIAAADEALRQTNLSAVADEMLPNLSGGTQQRAFLAMALAQDAPVILMDEPTSFMDIAHQLRLMHLCRSLADDGRAIGMVLHDLPMALGYADEIVVMAEGRIAACGTPDEIFASGTLNRVFGVEMGRMHTGRGMTYYYE